MERSAFIEQILPGAQEGYRKYRILPSLTLAQAILESDWGTRMADNNVFGIKATSSWKGDTVEAWTNEYIDGKMQRVKAVFRAYGSIAESIADHIELVGKAARYQAVRETDNYKDAAQAIAKAGYATDPMYAEKLIAIIESNGLDQYDRQPEEHHWAEEIWQELNNMGIAVYEKRYDDPATRGEVMALILRAVKYIASVAHP
ncbi:MAG: Flagellar protein FlgJ [peptidoglycan hydrolase] [Firmicutes bacterium]|nr:Flagellar protein FlgJ [peptidoglycan hydrolase] [Bacillota bacterium]MDI6705793.1 glycoside hydrolase family 73 protein [Bacillota bacterium]